MGLPKESELKFLIKAGKEECNYSKIKFKRINIS
jgi:hypothetical protein